MHRQTNRQTLLQAWSDQVQNRQYSSIEHVQRDWGVRREGGLKGAYQGKRELIDEGGTGLCQELHVNEASSPRLAQLH